MNYYLAKNSFLDLQMNYQFGTFSSVGRGSAKLLDGIADPLAIIWTYVLKDCDESSLRLDLVKSYATFLYEALFSFKYLEYRRT